MLIALVHNAVLDPNYAAEADVLVQRDAIRVALEQQGHDVITLSCTLDLEQLRQRLEELKPEVIFNLVEMLGGSDSLIHLAPSLFEMLGLPYTGCPAAALMMTTNKVLAKQQLRRAGLPTPDWWTVGENGDNERFVMNGEQFIVKAISEHASLGMDDDSVIRDANPTKLAEAIRFRQQKTGRPHFAERFVDGREFSVPFLSLDGELTVLPPSEIDFSQLPAGKPQIVGYGAKWLEGSVEYEATPRSFEIATCDHPIYDQLVQLAKRCWTLFDLRGYARVDFRVNQAGQPFVLEVNANPCLSPDAGYAAALERFGLTYEKAMEKIVAAATC